MRSRPAPSAPSMATPAAATTARVTAALTNTALNVHPARAASAPRRRYWRKANTDETTGPAGMELAMAVDARVTAVRRPRDMSTPPAWRSRRWTKAKATNEINSATEAATIHGHRR